MWKWNPCWSFIKGLQLSKQQFYSKSLAPGLWENSKLEPGLRENSKTYWEEGCVEDDEVKGEGEEDGSAEVVVLPWGHSEKRLVFRHTEMLKLKVLNRWCFSSYNFRCQIGWGSERNCTVFDLSQKYNLPVNGIKHLDGDQDWKGHGHRVGISKDLTVKAFVCFVVRMTGHMMRLEEKVLRNQNECVQN